MANLGLAEAERSKLTKWLMAAKQAMRKAKAGEELDAEAAAHQ